jgi:hypothetical protein
MNSHPYKHTHSTPMSTSFQHSFAVDIVRTQVVKAALLNLTNVPTIGGWKHFSPAATGGLLIPSVKVREHPLNLTNLKVL